MHEAWGTWQGWGKKERAAGEGETVFSGHGSWPLCSWAYTSSDSLHKIKPENIPAWLPDELMRLHTPGWGAIGNRRLPGKGEAFFFRSVVAGRWSKLGGIVSHPSAHKRHWMYFVGHPKRRGCESCTGIWDREVQNILCTCMILSNNKWKLIIKAMHSTKP